MSVELSKLENLKNPSEGENTTIYKISDQNLTILWDDNKKCWVQVSNTLFAAAKELDQTGLQIKFLGDEQFELYYNDILFKPEGNVILKRKLLGGGSGSGTVDSLPAEKVTYYNDLTEATNVKENLDEINSTLVGLADYLSTL